MGKMTNVRTDKNSSIILVPILMSEPFFFLELVLILTMI